MDGEKRFVLVVICFTIFCVTILYIFLFITLWPYRLWVGVSLLLVIVGPLTGFVVVGILGSLNEQQLRRERVGTGEYPLRPSGEPYYIPGDAQVYPQQAYPYSTYNTYRSYQEQERSYYGD